MHKAAARGALPSMRSIRLRAGALTLPHAAMVGGAGGADQGTYAT